MTVASARSYDAVVVGGGHNGLVSAAYLGRAGLDVLPVRGDDEPSRRPRA